MDVDGVDIEVLYCEVSAYRYLYLLDLAAISNIDAGVQAATHRRV